MTTRVAVDRTVEIIHDAGEGHRPRYRVGSGFLVGGTIVLTAGHVVGDGELTVRLDGSRRYEATLRKRATANEGCDLAILEIIDPLFDRHPEPTGFARVDRAANDDLEGCWTVGFPAFKEKPVAGSDGRLRDTVQLRGRIAPGSNLVSGLLELEVTATPRPLSQTVSGSEWEGISGSVVFARHAGTGHLAVGVIAEHLRPEGSSSLTVVPITAIDDLTDAGEWWSLLGIDPVSLAVLPAERQAEDSGYRASVAELVRRTPQLLGRDDELAELAAFAIGGEGYRWLIGGPWAGKSALAAHLTTDLGPEVDWVAYFLVRRLGDADSTEFLRVVNDQLAHLLGEDPPTPADDPHAFRRLWEQAATQARKRQRHLLLIVDGLDEDVSRSTGRPSVASLLPTLAGGHAHVLVTGRLHPELPADVGLEHPLRRTRREILESSPYATELMERAEQELEAVLAPAGPDNPETGQARDVLALLAAAAGPLTVKDLGALCAQPAVAVQRILDRQLSRVVQPVGLADAMRYVFAHETMREASEAYFEAFEDLGPARERIIQWAERWRQRGWPIEESPTYLLDAYPGMLAACAPQELAVLQRDPFAWIEAAVATVGVDRAAGMLRLGAGHASTPSTTSRLARAMVREAHHLRDPKRIRRPGYTRQQLCLAALAASDVELAEAARREIEKLPGTHMVPCWTTFRQNLALEQTLTGHTDWVTSVAVTPDGGTIVSGSRDGTIRLWDSSSGVALGEALAGRSGAVTSVTVTPDGTRIVSGNGDNTIRVWDLATGVPLGEPLTPPASGWNSGVAIPAGLIIQRLPWESHLRTGDLEAALQEHLIDKVNWVRALAVTPDGTRIVSGGENGTIRVWDLATGSPMGKALAGHSRAVTSLAVTPDGTRIVSASDDRTIRVWDLASGSLLREPLAGHWYPVTSVTVTPDGKKIVSGGGDGIRVWALATGERLGKRIKGHTRRVSCVAVTPDGKKIVSGGEDATIRVWDLRTRKPKGKPLAAHAGGVTSVALTPEGTKIVSGGEYATIRVWDPLRGEVRTEPLVGHSSYARCLAVSPDGTWVLIGGDDGTIRILQLVSGLLVSEPLRSWVGSVYSLALTPDGSKIVSGADDRTVRVWDFTTGVLVGKPLTGHAGPVSSVAVTPDGTRILSGSYDGTVRVWDLATGSLIGRPLSGHSDCVNSLAITPDATGIVSGSRDGTIRLWDLATGAHLGEPIRGHNKGVNSVALTSDATRIVSGGEDGTIRVWDMATRKRRGETLKGHSKGVNSVALTSDATRIVSGGEDGTVRVWDLATGVCLVEAGCFAAVQAVAVGLAADSPLVAAGDSAGCLTTWRLLEKPPRVPCLPPGNPSLGRMV